MDNRFHPLWVVRSFGDRYMTGAREIAAIDQAQRILSPESSNPIWMSLARGALEIWADERGLILYETSSEDEE